jgi:hypothetical protein
VPGREPDRARVLGDVGEPHRAGLAEDDAEDAAPAGLVADRRACLLVHPGREEALESRAGRVHDRERRVLCTRELGGGLDDALQQGVERELRAEGDPGVDEEPESVRVGRRSGGCALHDSGA